MLTDPFLDRMSEAFPDFYARVDAEALAEAQRLLRASNGDVPRALVRARMEAAGALWWPYIQGSLPFVGNEGAAREGFARLVLITDHVVGFRPQGMEAARTHVLDVLRGTLDVERLMRIARRGDEGQAAVAGAGIVASVTALVAPIGIARRVVRVAKWLPLPARVAIGGAAVAALASIPLVAAYSAGLRAERAARDFGESTPKGTSIPLERSVRS